MYKYLYFTDLSDYVIRCANIAKQVSLPIKMQVVSVNALKNSL